MPWAYRMRLGGACGPAAGAADTGRSGRRLDPHVERRVRRAVRGDRGRHPVDVRRRGRRLGQPGAPVLHGPPAQRAPQRRRPPGHRRAAGGPHRPGRDRPRVHLRPAEDPGPLHPGVRPIRGAHQGPARTGDLARVLDAGDRHRRAPGGRPAARSTSWRTSAASRPSSTAPSMDPATRAPAGSAGPHTLAAGPLRRRLPRVRRRVGEGGRPLARRRRSSITRGPRPTCRPGPAGCSTIRSS